MGKRPPGKRPLGAPLVLIALLGLAGCVAVDNFGSRALAYNQQAEEIKESQLMLNVMRAAYREPLQFTDFTQVTGQTSASGTAAFTLPFNPSPPTFGHADTASPSATLSGSQAFTVANLDTKEFYEGILSPIPLTSIDYYMEQGFPKALLLTLLISRIDIATHGGLPQVFYNDYYRDNFRRFEFVITALVDLGLSSEVAKNVANIGPPLTANEISSLRALAPLTEGAELKLFTPASDPFITPDERADLARQGVTEYYRLQRTSEQSRFCIDRNNQNLQAASETLAALGVLAPGDTIIGPPREPQAAVEEAEAQACGASARVRADVEERLGYAEPRNRFAAAVRTASGEITTVSFDVRLTIRSVEGIIYYLGELARGELDIGVGQTLAPPEIDTGLGIDRLFEVRQGCFATADRIVALYDGVRYCVAVDPSGADRSSEVMEVVLQLLALNTSAQTLPAPSVISILGP
ncbi:MAG TPA: hypothetical protein VMA37_13285 [Acetobacteraceae bacterium]|nr:hypothetical protein [Acetobacteraceae bacterium]